MITTLTKTQGRVPVTILAIQGELDGSSYQDLIARGNEAYLAGARYLLIDMGAMSFMSSAGLMALHNLAVLFQGGQPPDPESGWAALRAVRKDRDTGLQQQVKLLNPQPQIYRALETTGMTEFFEIHTDLQTAVASF